MAHYHSATKKYLNGHMGRSRDQPSTSRDAYSGDGRSKRRSNHSRNVATQSTPRRNHENIRMIVATVEGSPPASQSEFVKKLDAHFRKFGGIHCVKQSSTDARDYLITYRHASTVLSVLTEIGPHYIDNVPVHVRPAPHELQPNRPHDYLSELPTLCMQNVLSHLNRYDLHRLSKVSNGHLQAEIRYSQETRNIHFNRFEWQVIREQKLVLSETRGPTDYMINFIKCMRDELKTIEFNLDGPMQTHGRNTVWLCLLRDCVRYLAPSSRLKRLVLKYFNFTGERITRFLPIFRHLTTLVLYRVICDDKQLTTVMQSTNTIQHLELMHMNQTTGLFLLNHSCQLLSLSIYKCVNVLAPEHQIGFIRHNRQLRELTWTKSPGIDTFHFLLIAKYWHHLEIFDFDTHYQRSESAFWPHQPDLCELQRLSSLKKLYLRFDRRFRGISVDAPIRLIVDANALVELTVNNTMLLNALLIALGRAQNLRSLVLTNLLADYWELNTHGYEYFDPLCDQPILELALKLKHLKYFGISVNSTLQKYPRWLVRFVERATRLETLFLAPNNHLFSVNLFYDLIPVCVARGLHARLLVLAADLNDDDMDECRDIVREHSAANVINLRQWDDD